MPPTAASSVQGVMVTGEVQTPTRRGVCWGRGFGRTGRSLSSPRAWGQGARTQHRPPPPLPLRVGTEPWSRAPKRAAKSHGHPVCREAFGQRWLTPPGARSSRPPHVSLRTIYKPDGTCEPTETRTDSEWRGPPVPADPGHFPDRCTGCFCNDFDLGG